MSQSTTQLDFALLNGFAAVAAGTPARGVANIAAAEEGQVHADVPKAGFCRQVRCLTLSLMPSGRRRAWQFFCESCQHSTSVRCYWPTLLLVHPLQLNQGW